MRYLETDSMLEIVRIDRPSLRIVKNQMNMCILTRLHSSDLNANSSARPASGISFCYNFKCFSLLCSRCDEEYDGKAWCGRGCQPPHKQRQAPAQSFRGPEFGPKNWNLLAPLPLPELSRPQKLLQSKLKKPFLDLGQP